MDKEHESYVGRNVSVRYFVKILVERKFLPPITKERDVWIQFLSKAPAQNEAIKMEVGIEDCLHIEFEYERRAYHLQDVIIGKIHFLLVRIKIKHMELAVIRRETSGEGVAALSSGVVGDPSQTGQSTNIFTETQTLVKYGEITTFRYYICFGIVFGVFLHGLYYLLREKYFMYALLCIL
jgi:vacuolar protein sorting-associated protein 26